MAFTVANYHFQGPFFWGMADMPSVPGIVAITEVTPHGIDLIELRDVDDVRSTLLRLGPTMGARPRRNGNSFLAAIVEANRERREQALLNLQPHLVSLDL